MDVFPIITGLFGALLGCLLTVVVMRRRTHLENRYRLQEVSAAQAVLEERLKVRAREYDLLSERLALVASEHRTASESLSAARVRIAELETLLREERKQATEKVDLLVNARQQLQLEFQSLAQRIFDEKTRHFADQSRHNLDQLLDPFRNQIKEFEKKVEDTYSKEARERFSLRQEVLRLQDLNQQIQTDAVNLTRALKGQAKTQGTWGEIVLERILELSGLHKGREFEAQGSYRDAQGRQMRPDVVVHLPERKDVVIDSKVSLTAYERYVNAADEEQRGQALRQHLASLHGHLKDLQSKQYQALPAISSLDFVLMFIPVEGAFLLALEGDEQLFRKAFEQNIMIVSPSTLLVTLRTIQNIWRYEYQNQNAVEIARQAGNLYDHFVRFVGDLEKIGELLDRTRQSYDQAYKRLTTGRGNLVRRAESLRQLGINNSSVLSVGIAEKSRLDLDPE